MRRPAVVLVLGLVAIVSAACAAPTPTPSASIAGFPAATRVAPPTIAATTAPGASPSSAGGLVPWADDVPAGGGFERHAVAPEVRIAGILASDDELVAYGIAPATADRPLGTPAVWTTDASGGWSMQALPVDRRTAEALPEVGLAAGGTVVLGGRGGSSACAHPDLGTSWSRVPAGDWSLAPAQPGDCWRQPEAIALAPGGDGFVELTAGAGEVYSVWRSADGRAWRETPSGRDLGRTNQLFSIATVGGTTVITGRRGGATSTAWASSDLAAWSATTLAAGDGVDALDVFAAGSRFLVPVTRGDALAGILAWDGRAPGWSAGTIPDGATSLAHAASAGPTTVLVGSAGDRPAAWTTSDSSTWHRIDLDPAAGGAQDVAIAGDRIVVLGWLDGPSGDQVPVAWTARWPIP